MYARILVALENSEADSAILPHVAKLAKQLGSELLLLHVADGWAARNFDQLKLAESDEMKEDKDYLDGTSRQLQEQGLKVSALLAFGSPPEEILKTADAEQCDLIAMTSHGHRLIGDIIHGSTISQVRHKSTIPILLVHAEKK